MLERLQKIIARAGIASRRHAEELIRSGQVRVNGVVVTELGAKADAEHDRIEAAGKAAHVSEEHVYVLLNKPAGVVTTASDPQGRRTVVDLVAREARRMTIEHAISNGFGFGGVNASIIFRRWS